MYSVSAFVNMSMMSAKESSVNGRGEDAMRAMMSLSQRAGCG